MIVDAKQKLAAGIIAQREYNVLAAGAKLADKL